MKLYAIALAYLALTLLAGIGAAVSFWFGGSAQIDVCEGTCGFLFELSRWGTQVFYVVGWVALLLLARRSSKGVALGLAYFAGIFAVDAPAVFTHLKILGPMWPHESIPYSWEVLRLAWPLMGFGIMLLLGSTLLKPNMTLERTR